MFVVQAEMVLLEVEESWSWLLVSWLVSSLREVRRRLLLMVAATFVGVAENKQEGRNRRISKKGHLGEESYISDNVSHVIRAAK